MIERCEPLARSGYCRPTRHTVHEERGAALIIAVAIFVVLLFIGLTFYSQARLELRAATNNQDSFKTEMIAAGGQAIAVAQLRLDKRQHPNYTSLDHGWNTLFNGAWLAGKPWAFRPDAYTGGRVLDQTWVTWAGNNVYKRVPHIDYWADVKLMEAELARTTQLALLGDDVDGSGRIEPDEIDQALGTALAAIKNPLWVPRYQIDSTDPDLPSLAALLDGDFGGSSDWPVQYAYDFTLYDAAYDTPSAIISADYDPFDGNWPARITTPQQKINIWADVDNDGDGLRDSMWLPIAVEIFFGGIDRDGDGRVGAGPIELDSNNDGVVDQILGGGDDEGGDGIDNDLDGVVDEQDETALYVYWGGNDGRDNDNDGNRDEADEQRVFLTAPLIADSYWGGNDGIDNDGDGLIDETDERRIYLTSEDRIDNDGDGDIDFNDPGECIPLLDTFYVRVNIQTLNEYVGPATPQFSTNTDNRLQLVDPGDPFGPAVDRLDNDYTQIINDTHGHVYLEPNVPERDASGNLNSPWDVLIADMQQNRARSYNRINPAVYPVSGFVNDAPGFNPVITAAGESVCEVVGRVAVQIVDEASKINLNAAGTLATATPQLNPGSAATDGFRYSQNNELFTFARNEGINPGEYETRLIPDIGVARALDIAMARTGQHKGPNAGSGKPQNFPLLNPLDGNDSDGNGTVDNAAEAGYSYDMYFGGFGRADDNANVLQLQFNGLDDDGDGMYYIYDGVDNDGDGFVDEEDEARFGIDEPFEGIDEPAELQIFRPLRHRIAELDGVDNDNDGSIDEIGELGDRLYRTGDEMQGALALASNQSGVGQMSPLRSIVTVQSSDPNARYQHYVRDLNGDFARNLPADNAPVTGIKLDLNVALASSIVPALKEDWSYPATNEILITEAHFPPSPLNAALNGNPFVFTTSDSADSIGNETDYRNALGLEAAYIAGLRDEAITRVDTPVGIADARLATAAVPIPPAYIEADAGLRAFQLSLNIADARDTDKVRNTATYKQGDDWWTTLFAPGATQPIREMTYKFAGTESIRINELMVRAVRRIEAESNVDNTNRPENNTELMADGIVLDFDFVSETYAQRHGTANTIANNWLLFPDPGRFGPGIQSGFVTEGDTASDGAENAIQFTIGPSAQVPPGRYYLTVNTIGENGEPTVLTPNDIEYRFKYVRVGSEPDILDDINAGPNPFNSPLAIDATVRPDPIVGSRNGANAGQLTADPLDEDESGWVFLPSRDVRVNPATLPVGAAGYAGIPGEIGLQNEAFTVIVPPYATTTTDQYYLCVAIIPIGATPAEPIAINFLELSQEPDHEWVEIVNVSESPDPIDLSGWLLEIGGGTADLSNAIYTIPNGTFIAPNGSLLLTAGKYDVGTALFADPTSVSTLFASNGIGMANVPNDTANALSGISEAPIPRYATRGDDDFIGTLNPGIPWTGQWGVPIGTVDGGASIFQRPTGAVDFVDLDGDGLADPAGIEDLVISTDEGPTSTGDKPWDRIVQLIPPLSHPLNFRNTVASTEDDRLDPVAEMVLRGGILPNYPDEDMIDNDGDNAELMRDGLDNDGDRFLLDFDGVDNDGDGLFDEGSDGLDNDNDGLVDEPDESEIDTSVIPNRTAVDEIDEGIDEGRRYRKLGLPVPGGFHRDPVLFVYRNEPGYVQGLGSYPEWKDYVERRFFPGDAVRVTLYEGRPEEPYVVDRVTYTQNDVENRAPDDVFAPGISLPAEYLERFCMGIPGSGEGIPRAWPVNTMGVDFYRSLERKHPLYHGDRVGTANRWTATDGNYDDWGHGTNRYYFASAESSPTTIAFASILNEMQYTVNGTPTAIDGEVFFGHGLSGSPLRANFFQRVLEDVRMTTIQDTEEFPGDFAHVVEDPLVGDNHAILARARVRDANFRSPGDLLTVPHMTLARTYAANSFNLLGRESLQGAQALPDDVLVNGTPPPFLKGASIGMDHPKDLRALLDIASHDSISLNVGQADFYSLYPYMTAIINTDQTLVEWQASSNDYRAPRAWSPVFLASLDPNGTEPESIDFAGMSTIVVTQTGTPQYPHLLEAAGYPIQMAFLYRNSDLSRVPPFTNTQWLLSDTATATSDASVRWPLERRAVMYVSTNPDGFNPNADTNPGNTYTGDPHLETPPIGLDNIYPSEALFVWDGADGLANGEYDVYVVTMPDLSGLVESTRRFDPNRNDWLPNKLANARRQLPIDIMFLTDKDGDRKVWLENGPAPNPQPGLPDSVELGFNTQDLVTPRERFPLKAGLEPSSDGIVHYGVVKVENNYLAMFARNWAMPGVDNVNAVSRVILMTRDRTPGRINVNTAITQPIARDAAGNNRDPFNTMMGLIGMHADNSVGFNPKPWADLANPGVTDPAYLAALIRATQLTGPSTLNAADQRFLSRGERLVDANNDGVADEPIDLNGDGIPEGLTRYDGRYLLSPGELVVGGDESTFEARPFVMMPGLVPQYYDLGVLPTPLEKAFLFDEIKERYARMSNSITTVSDTFEIFVTAQSGYAFDANGDGVVNWRDDKEFVVTGEKKTRTVYER